MVRNCGASKMETTFYEDQSFQQRLVGGNSDVNQLKRSMTLDLRGGVSAASKRPKFNPAVTGAPVLSSPDLNLLKLASPELEKLIISSNNGMVTTTPAPTTQILFPRLVTEEQELYARGFVEALNELHGGGGSCDSTSQMSGVQQPVSGVDVVPVTAGATYTTLEPQQGAPPQTSVSTTFPPISSGASSYGLVMSPPPPTSHHLSDIIVKDEPQTVPSLGSTPPLSPINMECQEKIKLERKRQRNRIAASKCRRRKLERISRLEDKVKLLKGENSELGSVVHKLKEQVCQLKEQVMDHVHSGCQIMIANHF